MISFICVSFQENIYGIRLSPWSFYLLYNIDFYKYIIFIYQKQLLDIIQLKIQLKINESNVLE